ncbi:DUF4328 domain-containing protein [Streptomyces sp. NPDC019208]|uniref:DUF4328 domain-containing protein n=1 Tax=unclassified Streptomyces TaxID=2593676 RepID=UPI00340A80C2
MSALPMFTPRPEFRVPVSTGLAAATCALLGLAVLADVFSLGAGRQYYSLWSGLDEEGFPTAPLEEFERVEGLYSLSGVVQTVTFLVCGIVFIVWFRQMRENAQLFAPDAHRKSPGWAVWGWIVPVVFLWFPRRITLDIWTASELRRDVPDAPRTPVTIVNVWWTVWICDVMLSNLASRYYVRAEEADAIKQAVGLLMVADVLDIGAAVMAILVVRRLTRMQQRRAAWAGSGQDSPLEASGQPA